MPKLLKDHLSPYYMITVCSRFDQELRAFSLGRWGIASAITRVINVHKEVAEPVARLPDVDVRPLHTMLMEQPGSWWFSHGFDKHSLQIHCIEPTITQISSADLYR